MPIQYTAEERDAIRARIREAALQSFQEKGLKKTTLADLTGPAGIAKSTFYQFWDSKEELYLELLIELGDRVRRRTVAEGLHRGAGTKDALRRYLYGAVAVIDAEPLYKRVISRPDDLAQLLKKMTPEQVSEASDSGINDVLDFVAREQAAGRIAGDDPGTVLGVLRGVLLLPVHEPEFGDGYRSVLEATIEAVTTGLTTEH
ncbi:TetR/AcrR family transcriptional regulator [Salininema proteolyticum]|uniref:TetR/AcrR family transcriptional regulator n=1 Tax=Salininema proteolyticum TaxID=1607685 RepID=A0ABV8U6W1_9ACTN